MISTVGKGFRKRFRDFLAAIDRILGNIPYRFKKKGAQASSKKDRYAGLKGRFRLERFGITLAIRL
jgi:hypothetical protein